MIEFSTVPGTPQASGKWLICWLVCCQISISTNPFAGFCMPEERLRIVLLRLLTFSLWICIRVFPGETLGWCLQSERSPILWRHLKLETDRDPRTFQWAVKNQPHQCFRPRGWWRLPQPSLPWLCQQVCKPLNPCIKNTPTWNTQSSFCFPD